MANILLISPYSGDGHLDPEARMKRKRMFLTPHLGLHRIASFLRPQHNVIVYDPSVDGDPIGFLKSAASGFDVIGFSLTHTTLEHDLSLIHMARKANSKAVLVAGGEEATFNWELVRKYSPVNVIVFGEGEKAMKRIAELVAGGGLLSGNYVNLLDALSCGEFRDATVGIDQSAIPYEVYWDKMEKTNKNFEETRTVRIFTSNYCPWGCTFCSSTNYLKTAYSGRPKFSFLDADDLLHVIHKAVKAHPEARTIFFQDDNFLRPPARDRIYRLCDGIMRGVSERKIPEKLTFMCQSRVSDVSADVLKLMAAAGFRLFSYGVESFSSQMLNEFKKHITVEQIHDALAWTFEAGIVPFANMILTSPECEISDIKITVEECKKHMEKGGKLGINLYTSPLPGSKLAEEAKELIEHRRVNISGTSLFFDKSERIVPRNRDVRKLLERTSWHLNNINLEAIGDFDSDSKSKLNLLAVEAALKEERNSVY